MLASAVAAIAAAAPAHANPLRADMLAAFATNCLSPHLTAGIAADRIGPTGARFDFHDLAPFAGTAPSPAAGAVTPGTDRRCEVAFDGDHGAAAAETAQAALEAEGIDVAAPLPATHASGPGTTLLAARALNPYRIAVVHTGTRPGPAGVETFLSVERLTPEASAEVLR